MDLKYTVTFLGFRTVWGALGVILGVYALIRVRKREQYHTGTPTLIKSMWWFQIMLTPLSAVFSIWMILAFCGYVLQLGYVVLFLIPANFLALTNAFWLFVEATTKIPE